MSTRSIRLHRSSLLIPAALLCAAACQSTSSNAAEPESTRVELTDERSLSAQVVALDAADRGLTLRREDGEMLELQVGPAVRNYEQIAVGDTLRVRYEESLAVEKLPAGSEVRPLEAALAAGRAAPGETPGAGVALAWSARVRIESIDTKRAIVVFSLADGELVAHRLRTEEGRRFVEGLAFGDVVQLEYGQRLALGIEKLQ
jgi:hypothetical protein